MNHTEDHEHGAQQPCVAADHRARLHEARRWALAAGRGASTSALAVVLAAKAARSEPFDLWTVDTVSELVWAGIVGWCAEAEVDCPTRVAETLWTYLSFLQDACLFSVGSDPVTALRGPLVAVAGLTSDGRPRVKSQRHPAEQARRARSSARLAPVVPLRRVVGG